MRHRRHLAVALAAAIVHAAGSAAAQTTYQQPVVYSKTGQSVWGTSAAPAVSPSWAWDYTWNRSITLDGITGSPHVVIIPGECIPLIGCSHDVYGDTRTGSDVTAYTSGRAHFDASTQFRGGTLDVDYHATTAVQVKNPRSAYHPGDVVTLASSWAPAAGSSFTTNAPDYSAQARFGLGLTIGMDVTACSFGFGCSHDGGDIFSFDTGNFELAAINPNGQDAIRLLGLTSLGVQYDKKVTPGDIVPSATHALAVTPYSGDVSARSATATSPTDVLESYGQANLAYLSFDPVELAADHVSGFTHCLLSCSAFGTGYEVSSSTFGPVLGWAQDVTLTNASATTTYTFDQPVEWRRSPYYVPAVVNLPCNDPRVLAQFPNACRKSQFWTMRTHRLVTDPWSAASTSATLPAGVDIDIRYPDGGASLGVHTSFAATADVHNASSFLVEPRFALSLLTLDLSDGSEYGPALSHTVDGGFFNAGTFFDRTFSVALGAQAGASFALDLASPDAPIGGFLPGDSGPLAPADEFAPAAVPEPGALALVAGGLLALGLVRCRVRRAR